MGGAKEDDKKQSVLQKIFDKNPLLEYKTNVWLEKPKLATEWKWYDFDQSGPWSRNHIDQRVMESYDGLSRFERDRVTYGWSRHIYGLTNLTSDLFMPIGDTTSNACVKLELNALECMEHYGVKRGKALCMDYYDDFHECVNRHKQLLRMYAMEQKRKQRYREYLAGKRDYDSVYIPICKKGVYADPAPSPKDKTGMDAF